MFARSSFLFGYLWHVINTLKMDTTMVRIRDNRYSLRHFASVSLVVERSRCFKVTGRCHRKKEEKKFATKRKEKKDEEAENSAAGLAVKSVFFSFSVILAPCWPSKDLQRSTLDGSFRKSRIASSSINLEWLFNTTVSTTMILS